jgi:hypothetical protein
MNKIKTVGYEKFDLSKTGKYKISNYSKLRRSVFPFSLFRKIYRVIWKGNFFGWRITIKKAYWISKIPKNAIITSANFSFYDVKQKKSVPKNNI